MQHKIKGRFKKEKGKEEKKKVLSVTMQNIESLVSYLIFSLKIHSP